MAHIETTFRQQLTHGRGELEQAQEIGYCSTRTAQRISDRLVRKAELLRQPLYASRLFKRVQIFTLDIFDEGGRERLLIRYFLYQCGYRLKACHACGAPAAFARDDFI